MFKGLMFERPGDIKINFPEPIKNKKTINLKQETRLFQKLKNFKEKKLKNQNPKKQVFIDNSF